VVSVAGPPALAEDGARARGGLAWVFSDELDLTGTMAAEVDLFRGDGRRLVLAVDTVTAIEKSLGDFTFSVRDVQLDGRIAWRHPVGRGAWTVAGGRRLLEPVDREGGLGLWYASGAWESAGWTAPVPPPGFGMRVEAGAVLGARGLDADLLARGAARWTWRAGAAAVALEASADALAGGDDAGTDFRVGPRIDLPAGPARGLTLYAHWLRGRNPLGLRVDGVLAGFDIVASPAATPGSPDAAEVGGLVGVGVTDGARGVGRLLLRAASPRFAGALRVAAEVDAHVLGSAEAGDLWYGYSVGLDRPWRGGLLLAGFHHRSNHLLNAPNPAGVTSINVIEVGHDSPEWDRVPREARSRRGRLDWRARAGWLLDSSFGDDRGGHLRGGVRWSWRAPARRYAPFLSAEVEEGAAAARRIAAGCIHVEGGWEGRIEWSRDEQWFRADRSALALTWVGRYGPGGSGTSEAR
jgi:hypothetical protein